MLTVGRNFQSPKAFSKSVTKISKGPKTALNLLCGDQPVV